MEMSEYDEDQVTKESKTVHISLHLIAKNHLPADYAEWPHDKMVEELNKITHLRLDRQNIGSIDNLELLGSKLTNVYLQHNSIRYIENLECLTSLRFLTLSHNRIQEVSGLCKLVSLKFLDLSHNRVSVFDIDQLPCSLMILDFRGNPCTHMSDYRGSILQDMPSLKQLDGEHITKQEKRDVGFIVSSDSDDSDGTDDDLPTHKTLTETGIDIIMRSIQRGESDIATHRIKMKQLEECSEAMKQRQPNTPK